MTERIKELVDSKVASHGDYGTMARTAQQLKELIAGNSSTVLTRVQQYTLDMICVKIARIINGNPDIKDHWDDIAGYATLASDEIKPIVCPDGETYE